MIYKCNNCGRNFNFKPDFCECGNNEFVEVVENFDYSTVKTDFNSGKDVDFLYNQNNSAHNDDDFENENSYEKDLKKQRTSELVAIIVFVVVLITAVIMIISNVSVLVKKSHDKTASVEIESYIPSDVNEYWTDSKPTETSTNNARQGNNTNSVNTNSVNKKNVTTPAKPSVQKTLPKTEKNTSPKPVTKKQDSQKTQIVAKAKPEIVKPKTEVQKPITKPDNAISVEEYLRYKNSLRNRLFANFPILNVQGQGTAKIAFSVAPDGKLINRRFVSQSGNKSLDDAMYHMLMRVPVYAVPPAGFEGREIMMQMDFNNGHYSFSFLN